MQDNDVITVIVLSIAAVIISAFLVNCGTEVRMCIYKSGTAVQASSCIQAVNSRIRAEVE